MRRREFLPGEDLRFVAGADRRLLVCSRPRWSLAETIGKQYNLGR